MVKNWSRTSAVRPSTLKDGVGRVVALAIVSIHNRDHLAVASDDNTIGLFAIDAAGKLGQLSTKYSDAYALAAGELEQKDPNRREKALDILAGYNDTRAVELLARQIDVDPDFGVRVKAAQLLGDTGHPRAVKLLEGRFNRDNDAVRLAILASLRKLLGKDSLVPMQLALKSGHADVGIAAVQGLRELSGDDAIALTKLTEAFNHQTLEVRRAALLALETVHADTPEADLAALGSANSGDIRRLAIIRLLHRQMLDRDGVESALRLALEDREADVRKAACMVSVLARPALADALRARNATLHRQLFELETYTLEVDSAYEKTSGEQTTTYDRLPHRFRPRSAVPRLRALADRPEERQHVALTPAPPINRQSSTSR